MGFVGNVGDTPDTELIKRCQQGDRDSMCKLYQSYSKNALGTAFLIAESRGIAEDIVQEAFIEAFSRIKQLKVPETFDVWFYKILVRTGWRMVKKHNYFVPIPDESMEVMDGVFKATFSVDECDTKISINEALEKLSIPLKTVIILYYYNDMPIKEIAKVLGCFQGTVKSRLYNAKKQLFCELYGTFDENELPEGKINLPIGKELNFNAKHV